MRTAPREFLRFGLRDLALATLAGALLWADVHAALAGAAGVALGVVAGVVLAVVGFLVHEWGHWLGGALSGGVLRAPARLTAVFLFHFDTSESTRRQFLAMSAGGYLATLVGLGALVTLVDPGRVSGMVALGLSAVGVVVTFALEVPTTVRVARGGSLPTGGVYAGAE